jgi:AcrR family transcriptional regulator
MPGVRASRVLETRERIASAAMDLFARHGFDQVSVAAVAGAAGVTEKTVFNHFGTKEDLVYSRADEFGDALVAAVVHRAPGMPVFEALRSHLLDVYAAFPGAGAARHLALSRIVADSPALRAREQRIIAGYTARLAEAIPAAGDSPDGGPDLIPQVLADAVMCVHRAVIVAYRRAALDGQDPAAYGPRTLAAARAAFQLLADGLHDR